MHVRVCRPYLFQEIVDAVALFNTCTVPYLPQKASQLLAMLGNTMLVSSAVKGSGRKSRRFQTIFARQNVHALTVRSSTMLAGWLLACTFDLVGTTLDARTGCQKQ